MLGSTTKKLGQAVPGGWGDTESHENDNPTDQSGPQEEVGNLAAGVVGKTGEIVDEAGKTVGKVSEGQAGDFVGNVVTATGDIVGKDGGVVGKATPLGGESGGAEGQKGWGFSIMGAAKGVKGVVDTADGTVQTVNRGLPIVGDITKGLGLGGQSKEGETPKGGSSALLGGILGSKPEDRDPKEKAQVTEDAKNELFQDTDEAAQNAPPIDLKDQEAAGTQVESRSQPPQSETDTNVEPTEQTGNIAGGAEEQVPGEANPEDATGEAKDTTEAVEGAEEQVPSEAKPGDAAGEAKDTTEGAEAAADTAESKAGDAAEEAKSQAEEVETVAVPGDKLPRPFEKFEGAKIDDEGKVMFDEESVGKLVEGEPHDLANKEVDAEGNILDENGSVIGKAELKSNIAEDLINEATDYTVLKGAPVNKAGNLVNDKGEAIGRVSEGILKNLVGRKADENGKIWNDSGEVIGQAEPIPEKERQESKEPSPFEDFPEATVQSNGEITSEGNIIGRVTEGDAKQLKGKKVDEDGDILDRNGNVIGKAERWEPEPEPEPEEVDNSILAGKRVNKAGNVVDTNGSIFGKVTEGDLKRLAGRMCDKNGNVLSESGDVLGKAEVIPEGDREGFKEGPFAELPGCTINKEGHVVTPGGDVVGRLVSGDAKVLFGRAVDEDGDILDRNGNPLGKAERWEPPEVEKKKGPMAGRRVNKKGDVVDEDGNLIGRLTSGELSICSGNEIDDDSDVVDGKGKTVGHVSLIEDIPEEESEEDKKAREEAEQDEKLAKQLGGCIEQGLEKVQPICKMITDKIESAERKPKEELDEEELVKQVKPLIEQGGQILNELNGTIRALDPDGRIQRNAKHKASTRDASPSEYHLADVLKELTGTVTTCIDNAKKKVEDMPHAKKELNPLWGLMTEPLFQILAAVGLLLTGVLNLVGRLLNGLGLGGIVDGLLGSLGLNRLLDSLGLGSVTNAITGKK